jgi:hypothetical protein
MPFTIRPVTQREHQIARSLGVDGWELISPPNCVRRPSDVLIRKHGHMRWIRSTQVTEEK